MVKFHCTYVVPGFAGTEVLSVDALIPKLTSSKNYNFSCFLGILITKDEKLFLSTPKAKGCMKPFRESQKKPCRNQCGMLCNSL